MVGSVWAVVGCVRVLTLSVCDALPGSAFGKWGEQACAAMVQVENDRKARLGTGVDCSRRKRGDDSTGRWAMGERGRRAVKSERSQQRTLSLPISVDPKSQFTDGKKVHDYWTHQAMLVLPWMNPNRSSSRTGRIVLIDNRFIEQRRQPTITRQH